MNRVHHIVYLLLLGVLILFGSCDKTPVNGDLDGMWQLMTIKIQPDSVLQVKEKHVYLCIQLQLSEWRAFTNPGKNYYAHFKHQGDSLFFSDLCHASTHTASASDDRPVTASEMAAGAMTEWGIHTLHTRYRVLQLNTNHLTLEKADTVYAFRKF